MHLRFRNSLYQISKGQCRAPQTGAFHKRVRSANGSVPQTGAFHKRKRNAPVCRTHPLSCGMHWARSANGSVPLPFVERTRLRNAPNAFHKRVRSTNGSGTLPFAERAQCIPQTGAFHKRVRSTNGTFTYGVPPLFWDPKELFWNPRELFYKTKTKRSPSCAGDPPKRYGARCSMHDWGRKGPRNHVSQHAGMVVFYTRHGAAPTPREVCLPTELPHLAPPRATHTPSPRRFSGGSGTPPRLPARRRGDHCSRTPPPPRAPRGAPATTFHRMRG